MAATATIYKRSNTKMEWLDHLSKLRDIPLPTEPQYRTRTAETNKRQVDLILEYSKILEVAAEKTTAPIGQRVVLFGDSWFERFTYEGWSNGVGPFDKHVRSCAQQGPNSEGNKWLELLFEP